MAQYIQKSHINLVLAIPRYEEKIVHGRHVYIAWGHILPHNPALSKYEFLKSCSTPSERRPGWKPPADWEVSEQKPLPSFHLHNVPSSWEYKHWTDIFRRCLTTFSYYLFSLFEKEKGHWLPLFRVLMSKIQPFVWEVWGTSDPSVFLQNLPRTGTEWSIWLTYKHTAGK